MAFIYCFLGHNQADAKRCRVHLINVRLADKNQIASPRDRLLAILDGRRPQPWGQRLGLQSATITKMMRDGHLPTPRLLERIERAENVSLSWLLSGIGTPFIAVDGPPAAVMGAIRAAAAEPGPPWRVAVPITEGQMALVLFRQIALDEGLPEVVEIRIFGGRDLHATYTEALVGDESLLTRAPGPCWAIQTHAEEWADLAGGWAGTWELFGEVIVNEPLFGKAHKRIRDHQDLAGAISDWFQTPSMVAESEVWTGERDLLSAYRSLESDDRERALRMVRALRPPMK